MQNKKEPKAKKPNWLMSPIETKEFALEIIKQAGQGFLALAALQGVLGYFIQGWMALVDAGLLVALSIWLMKKQSVWAAVLLLTYAGISFVSTIMNYFGGNGGRNIILSVVAIAIAYKAVRATSFLQKKK